MKMLGSTTTSYRCISGGGVSGCRQSSVDLNRGIGVEDCVLRPAAADGYITYIFPNACSVYLDFVLCWELEGCSAFSPCCRTLNPLLLRSLQYCSSSGWETRDTAQCCGVVRAQMSGAVFSPPAGNIVPTPSIPSAGLCLYPMGGK